MSNTVKTLGISLPENLRDAGKAKARMERRSFSNYVTGLLIKDLNYAQPLQPTRKGNRKPVN
jgi:hypothetical protein